MGPVAIKRDSKDDLDENGWKIKIGFHECKIILSQAYKYVGEMVFVRVGMWKELMLIISSASPFAS